MSSVSVIVPCYKYGHFLEECVNSVLTQTGVDVRVLIIDDASPDNTFDVATKLAARDARVEYRRHTVNQGHIATFNEGIAAATGDYMVLLSADDMLTPGALLRATRLMDAHPEVGFVYGPALTFQTDKPRPQPRGTSDPCEWRIIPGLDWIEEVCSAGQAYIWSPEVVVRTSLQQALGGYLPELPMAGDQEMWMRFAAHGDVGKILDAEQAYYRIHGANMSAPQFANPLRDLSQRKAAFDSFFERYGHRIGDLEQMQTIKNRKIAGLALSSAGVEFERCGPSDTGVAQLIDFAVDTYPDAPHMLEYKVLRLRMRLGPKVSRVIRSVRRVLLPNRSGGHWEKIYDSFGLLRR